MYLFQTLRCICLKLQNVFVSNFKMYLSQTSNVFVSKCIYFVLSVATALGIDNGAWACYEMSEILKRLRVCDSQDYKWFQGPEFVNLGSFAKCHVIRAVDWWE